MCQQMVDLTNWPREVMLSKQCKIYTKPTIACLKSKYTTRVTMHATLFTILLFWPKSILKDPQPIFIWQTSQSIIVIGTYITSCGGSGGCGSCTSGSSGCGLAGTIGSWWPWNVTSEGSPTDWLGLALFSTLFLAGLSSRQRNKLNDKCFV